MCHEIGRDGQTYYMLECLSLEGLTADYAATTPKINPAAVAGSATYGTVVGTAEIGDYHAPNSAPARNVVAVSADYAVSARAAVMAVATDLR